MDLESCKDTVKKNREILYNQVTPAKMQFKILKNYCFELESEIFIYVNIVITLAQMVWTGSFHLASRTQ